MFLSAASSIKAAVLFDETKLKYLILECSSAAAEFESEGGDYVSRGWEDWHNLRVLLYECARPAAAPLDETRKRILVLHKSPTAARARVKTVIRCMEEPHVR
jgi:hypothetical protein